MNPAIPHTVFQTSIPLILDELSSTIDPGGVAAAEPLIRPYVRRTPVLEVDGADFGLPDVALALKLELLQHTGSFKPRGAFLNLLRHPIPASGVAAASGGNHGVAVAFAAQRLGCPATIFVPQVAAPPKLERIRQSGARLIITGRRYAEALEACEKWTAENGALPVHAYDHPDTLLGQGTLALEFEQQAPRLDTVLVAVGGGGLLGGMAAWYAGRVRLIGVEPELCPTLEHALRAGHPVDAPSGGIAADSLAPLQVGRLMFPLAQRFIDRVVLVSDEAIQDAQRALWRTVHVAAEPGGATAMAALLSGAYRPSPGERVGVVLCGANTPAVNFG